MPSLTGGVVRATVRAGHVPAEVKEESRVFQGPTTLSWPALSRLNIPASVPPGTGARVTSSQLSSWSRPDSDIAGAPSPAAQRTPVGTSGGRAWYFRGRDPPQNSSRIAAHSCGLLPLRSRLPAARYTVPDA